MAYRNARGVNTAIARIFNTFGPRMRPCDGRAIPTFIGQALRGEPLTVAGDGSQTRSVCYVDDLIEGLVRLLHSDLTGPVNLGNSGEMSVLELARLIIELTGSSSEIVFVDRPQDDPDRPPPRHHAGAHRPRLGTQVDVRDGLRRTIDWFRSQSLVLEACRCPCRASGRCDRVGGQAGGLRKACEVMSRFVHGGGGSVESNREFAVSETFSGLDGDGAWVRGPGLVGSLWRYRLAIVAVAAVAAIAGYAASLVLPARYEAQASLYLRDPG